MVCAYDQNVGNTTRGIGGERGGAGEHTTRLRLDDTLALKIGDLGHLDDSPPAQRKVSTNSSAQRLVSER